MSGFESLWGDEFTENDVAECTQLETQASQVPVPPSVHPGPSGRRNNNFLLGDSGVTNAPRPTPNALSHIPPFKCRDDQALRSTSTSSSSSSSSPALSLAQRKLKAPVRSLPDMSLSQNKDKIQSATTEWLRKELEKHKKQETELKQSRQTLEGEVRLLRERNNAYQQQLVKVREHSDQEIKLMEEKFLTQIKDLKKEAENAKMQLVMKSKESEANKERYLELKNVTVLEPEYQRTQTPARDRCRTLPKTPRLAIHHDDNAANVDDDNEEDYFSGNVVTKRPRREAQSDLKTFSCDELIRVMDGPGVTSPIKRPRDKPIVEIDLTASPAAGSDSTSVKSVQETETVVNVKNVEVLESKTTDLVSKFPWLKDKSFSLTVHLGQLLYKEISEKIYTLADPEIKIIVPPCIDFDPGNVLKMDCSDLKYLEDLEKGEKIWGVDLKTMYDTSKPTSEEPQVSEDDDPETLATVKTILGSQMCGQSPDQSRLSESFTEAHSPSNHLPAVSIVSKTKDHEDSILLRNLEPIHVHLRALTKLANWDSAMDLISSIIHHLTLMINELHERLCDPRIPDQLKDQFYNNEFAVGKLFMEGPYHSNDLLTHEKWTERERYVELRRGLAVLSMLCSLNRDTTNLVLDHELLEELLKSKSATIPSSNRNYNQESFMATSLRKQCQRKISCKVEESTLRYADLLKKEDDKVKRQIDRLTDKISGTIIIKDSSSSSSSATSTSSSAMQNHNLKIDIADNEVMSLLMKKGVNESMKAAEDEDNQSIGSNPSTVNPDEIMEIENEIVEGDIPSSVPRSLDEIDHDSFKAWYETYTQNKVNFTVEDTQTSGSKTHRYSKLLDPQLAENERKELSVYLKRRKFCKEFYKSVVEKGSVWEPMQDKNDEGGYMSDLESVMNLYDYENKISTMNSTITSDELASMRPGTFCSENKDLIMDTDTAVKTQEESPEDNEWRVNSLQKNEEDPSLTKVEEPAKMSNEKNWSFFEKFKTNNAETSKGLSNIDSLAAFSGPDFRLKQPKARKHSLAPLKKKGGRDASPTGSLTDINKEMEMEVEMLFGKSGGVKKFDKQKRHHQDVNDMSPFAPELRFPEALSDDDQKSETLTEHISRLPTMEDPEFIQHFKSLYNQAEAISARLGIKLKPFKYLVTCSYLDKQRKDSAEEMKKKNEVTRRPKKSLNSDKEAGPSGGGSMRNQDESDPIINMLNEEALKYSLNKNIKSFEKKKGNLHLLDGIYEIVSAINYSRLTLVFYPLLSSCVSLIESLFKQSFNNEYFNRELFVLIMKILNEVTCCQPPPDIIEKVLGVLMYAVNTLDIVECLCKKRSNLVSLVTKTEFCFFKGVCMMQPLCYLVGALSSTSYPGYWTLCLAFTRWLRQLYDRYRLHLEPWYPPNQVCNCVPVLHSALFTTLAKASAFLANHATSCNTEEGVRLTVESIVRDGIRLCEVLIDMDTGFVNHLDRFHLYNEFLATVKEMHYDPFFSPMFQLDSHQLKVVECLISANELVASKSKGASDRSRSEPPSLEQTKLNFNRVFDPNHIFLKCVDKYDLLC